MGSKSASTSQHGIMQTFHTQQEPVCQTPDSLPRPHSSISLSSTTGNVCLQTGYSQSRYPLCGPREQKKRKRGGNVFFHTHTPCLCLRLPCRGPQQHGWSDLQRCLHRHTVAETQREGDPTTPSSLFAFEKKIEVWLKKTKNSQTFKNDDHCVWLC